MVASDRESSASVDLIDVRHGRTVVLRLSGILDLATVPAVEDLITALWSSGDLVLDLADLRLCDCTGLGMFVRLSRRCAAMGRSLRLVAPGGLVLTVMTMLEFGDTVPVYTDLTAARRADAAHRTARTPTAASGSWDVGH
jgi:anti-anti-sigma factor